LVLVRLRIDVNATNVIIETHNIGNIKVAEIIADKIILTSTEDGLELLGNLYYQGFDKIIIHEKNITPEFFDLKTKIAGNILQKFAQYQMPLIIVGDFSKYKSKSLNDFIFESNKGSQVNFVSDLSRVLQPV
jgi:alpha/beta hydrolase